MRNRDWYIIVDHPAGEMLVTELETVRFWLREGKKVLRVTGTERVTELSLDIDDFDDAGMRS